MPLSQLLNPRFLRSCTCSYYGQYVTDNSICEGEREMVYDCAANLDCELYFNLCRITIRQTEKFDENTW